MKAIPFSILLTFLLFWSACSDKHEEQLIIESCSAIANSILLSEEEKLTTCIYNQVYQFQSDIYMVCECCVCDKAPMAFNCDTIPLCDIYEDCMIDFLENAEYLFSVGD